MRSITTIGSCSKASRSDSASSTEPVAFEIPTDEPSLAGFTNTGIGNDSRGRSPSRTTA